MLNHRTEIVTTVSVLGLMMVATGCKVSGEAAAANRTIIKETIGTAAADNLTIQGERVLTRLGYTIYRRENQEVIYIETDWSNRLPNDGEQELGIAEVRTKIILRGRPYMRGEYTVSDPLYTVYFEGFTEYRLPDTPTWITMDLNEEATAYVKGVAYELKTEIAGRFLR